MNAVQCDQCGTFAANPKGRYGPREYVRDLPEPWVSMSAGRGEADEARGDFCSMRCAGLFLLDWQPPAELTEDERLISRKVFGARDETGKLV